MDDKNESKKLMEELKRIGEGFNKFIESIGEALNELFYPKEDDWEMKCPYKEGDEHYCLQPSGDVFQNFWDGIEAGNKYFSQGNIFLTEQEAETEAKRRNLLTRFRAFRDECNGDWKVDWSSDDRKWSISKNEDGLFDTWTIGLDIFAIFGYFKNQEDVERAIKLFGDEIIDLFVDCEVQ